MDLQVLMPALLSWAVHLSGYDAPAEAPKLEYRLHDFFVEEVCGNRECRVIGWYNDKGVVYIDESLRYSTSSFAKSLVVHELVHFLQHQSGEFDSLSCEHSVRREREAYSVQSDYMLRLGNAVNPIRPQPTFCHYDAQQDSAAVPRELAKADIE